MIYFKSRRAGILRWFQILWALLTAWINQQPISAGPNPITSEKIWPTSINFVFYPTSLSRQRVEHFHPVNTIISLQNTSFDPCWQHWKEALIWSFGWTIIAHQTQNHLKLHSHFGVMYIKVTSSFDWDHDFWLTKKRPRTPLVFGETFRKAQLLELKSAKSEPCPWLFFRAKIRHGRKWNWIPVVQLLRLTHFKLRNMCFVWCVLFFFTGGTMTKGLKWWWTIVHRIFLF